MENFHHLLKKSSIYPEEIIPAQIKSKNNSTSMNSNNNQQPEIINATIPSTSQTMDSQSTVSQEFIQTQMRRLIASFSNRTRTVKEHIANSASLPETSSSSQTSFNSRRSSSSPTTEPPIVITASSNYGPTDFDPTVQQQIIEASSPLPPPSTTTSTIQKNKDQMKLLLNRFLQFWVIDPNGAIYIIWMSIVAMGVLYNAWVIPLRGTFSYQTASNRHIWWFFDYFVDLLYVLDVLVVQPRTTYLLEGFHVTDSQLLRRNYMRKLSFKLDLASLIPLDVLYVFVGSDVVLLRLGRLLKVHTFWEFFYLVDKLLSSPYCIRVARTLLYMLYLIHVNACAYYAFSVWHGIGSNHFVFNGVGNAYIKCFYFATKTATSIGKNPKPTQITEYLFMTVSWLMGVFVFALLIGQIRDIISTATRAKTRYRNLMNETLEYMRRVGMPEDAQKRVKLWFSYTWQVQRTLDANTIMDCLPQKLKTDVAINIHIQTLNKVNLFADCDEALLRELVLQLRSVIYLPGDIICQKGDVGKEMYIVQSGRVQVLAPSSSTSDKSWEQHQSQQVLATLSEGSVFGEISLLGIPGMSRRTADVRSEGYSNLFVLSKSDLNAAISHYPEAQQLLNKKAKTLMKKNAEAAAAASSKIGRKSISGTTDPLIVIENPIADSEQLLLDTVLQMLPANSKCSAMLRGGSKCRPPPRPENNQFRCRNSLPLLGGGNFSTNLNCEPLLESTVATVHSTALI